MLKFVNCQRDRVAGLWSRDGAEITMTSGEHALLMLPIRVSGSYELEVDFTRAAGSGAVVFILPVDNLAYVFFLGDEEAAFPGTKAAAGHSARQKQQNSAAGNPPRPIRPETRLRLLARVLAEADTVKIAVSANDRPCAEWQGNRASLKVPENWQLPGRQPPASADLRSARRFMPSGCV